MEDESCSWQEAKRRRKRGAGQKPSSSRGVAAHPPSKSWRGRGRGNVSIPQGSAGRQGESNRGSRGRGNDRGFHSGGNTSGRDDKSQAQPPVSISRSGTFYRNNDNTRPTFGFRRVESLLAKPDSEDGFVIASIANDLDAWVVFLESDALLSGSRNSRTEHKDVFLRMVVHLLGNRICGDDVLLTEYQDNILLATLNATKFLAKVQQKLSNLILYAAGVNYESSETSSKIDTSNKGFIKDVYEFCSLVVKRFPGSAQDYLKNTLVTTALGVVMTIKYQDPSVADLEEPLKSLTVQLDTLSKREEIKTALQTRRRGLTEDDWAYLDGMEPSSNFREMTVVPSIQELRTGRLEGPILRRNKPSGGYASADDYLDVQFRLLREDFVSPLRSGIQEYLRHPQEYSRKQKKMPLGSIRLYHGVQVLGSELIRGVTHLWLQLPQSMTSRVQWDRSKRLLPGSLLVLTNDSFKSAYFGLVGIRDEKILATDGTISFIPDADRPSVGNSEEFLLVECEVYFEAYRHVLEALQTLKLSSFPLAKFIVDAAIDVEPPTYLQQRPSVVLVIPPKQNNKVTANDAQNLYIQKQKKLDKVEQTFQSFAQKAMNACNPEAAEKIEMITAGRQMTINPLNENEWPSAQTLGLDQNQFVAFKGALTKEICIVQGPPGTGKTYLGLRIAEVLLKYNGLGMGEMGPIVVVCYTNHALDQFLEGIVDLFQKKVPSYQHQVNRKHMWDKPVAPIVRLGGRCKSEKLKPYDLFTTRKCTEWKPPPEIYRLRRDAETSVRNLSQAVGLLDAQGNELGKLDGIVDFRCLKVWKELSSEFPPLLWECLRNKEFFELTEPLIAKSNFLEESVLGIKNRNANFPLPFQRNMNLEVNKLVAPRENLKLNEDYNMDELMENRIAPERYEPYRRFQLPDGHYPIYFVDNLSIVGCKNTDSWLISQRRKLLAAEHPENKKKQKLEMQKIQKLNEIAKRQRENAVLASYLKAILPRVRSLTVDKDCVREKIEELWGYEVDCEVHFSSIVERWEVLLFVVERARELLLAERYQLEEILVTAERKLANIRRYVDIQVLKNCKFVGMTTTRAAKDYEILRSLNSKIVIVEEAAEVLEAHIVTCLTKSCQHLILIGDHLQLRPSTTVYQLATQYNLDISLFERMINNKLSLYPLKVQHRMRPEISELVRDTIYTELEDSPSVLLHPTVLGVTHNVFFISHAELEVSDADSLSKSNKFEADYLLGLCRYLILQGYTSSQITILSTYTGQMFLLKKLFRDLAIVQGVRITCVDNFQGEENDIILLSLVRSNEEGKVGFLKVDNRVCVSLSRAKHGMYILGNMTMLCEGSKIWPKIQNKLGENRIGNGLPITCQIHETTQIIKNGLKFRELAPAGGCTMPCATILELCGHKCPELCHAFDPHHLLYECLEKCIKTCSEEEAHPCQDLCYIKNCSPCKYRVTFILDRCGHAITTPCNVRRNEHKCQRKVFKELICGHTSPKVRCHLDATSIKCEILVEKMPPCNKYLSHMACHINPADYECKIKETKVLPCGHSKTLMCYEDETEVRCNVQVPKFLPCGHDQMEACHVALENVTCDTEINRVLECGHEKTILCKNKDKKIVCNSRCNALLDCGHLCHRTCHTDDGPCNTPPTVLTGRINAVEYLCAFEEMKTLPCGHSKMLKCFENDAPVLCKAPVLKLLPCDHKQKAACHLAEENVKCNTKIVKLLKCDHEMEILCKNKDNDEIQCAIKCMGTLNCGHVCQGLCHVDKDPEHTDYKCNEPCERQCEIGHDCEAKHHCHEKCPPCKVEVIKDLPCSHSAKLECHLAPEVFKSCMKGCTETLSCGHPCDKRCSEKCGPCMVPSTKTIPDCGHTILLPCSRTPMRDMCKVETFPKLGSSCHHEILVPCKLADALTPDEVLQLCRKKCTHTFLEIEDGGCGHECGGTCGRCRGGSFHQKCASKCERVLVCGHGCQFPCATKCPPCPQRCTRKCEHLECRKNCGRACSICYEPCGWQCEHKNCSKFCGEECDREPEKMQSFFSVAKIL